MTSAEKASNGIAAAALLLSGLALYYTSCQGARVTIGMAPQALLNAKPRVGLMMYVQNDGAKAITLVGGELKWDAIALRLVMTSPQLGTWTYTGTGRIKEAEKTTFTVVSPVQLEGHSSEPVTFWFSRDEQPGDRLFTSGDHVLEVRLFDGIRPDPVATRTFRCRLDAQQVVNVYAEGSETSEFTIPLTLGAGR